MPLTKPRELHDAVDLGDDRPAPWACAPRRARPRAADRPVMSLVLVDLPRDLGDDVAREDLGARRPPMRCAPDRQRVARRSSVASTASAPRPSTALIDTRGCSLPSWSSMTTLLREAGDLVDLLAHRHALHRCRGTRRRPLTSVRIGVVYGSHSTSTWPVGDLAARPAP